MSRAGILAIDYFMKVLGVIDIGWFQIGLIYNYKMNFFCDKYCLSINTIWQK